MMSSMSLTCVSLVVVVMMTTTSNVVVAETIIDAGYNALYGVQGKLKYVCLSKFSRIQLSKIILIDSVFCTLVPNACIYDKHKKPS